MNYVGRVLSQRFSGDFLKETLRKADMNMPYRGPEYYQSGQYTYKCNVAGDFTWFQGCEEIYIAKTRKCMSVISMVALRSNVICFRLNKS